MAVPNINQFTIGPNCSVAIYDQNTNQEMDWGLLTQINFTSMPVTHRVPVSLMMGYKQDLIFDEGYAGKIAIQRTGPKLDLYFSQLEAAVRAGVVRPTWKIIQTVNESDGTLSRYSFFNSGFTYDEAGDFSNENGVVQVLSFTSIAREVVNQ